MIHDTLKYTDYDLEKKIESLKTIVTSVIEKHYPKGDYCFKSYSEHYDDEPSKDPCVLVLCSDGDILVQAKRYKNDRPIELQAVQALTAVVDDQKANRNLFVTTSRYLPCAKNFASRHNSRIQLASSNEVAEWCDLASRRIIKEKSLLVEFEQIQKLLKGERTNGLEGKIFHATWGYSCTMNLYAMVIRETKWLALLVRLPEKIHTHDGYRQNGTNLPDTSLEALSMIDEFCVFRAKKEFDADKFTHLWGGQQLYSLWDGKPNYFNSD